MVKFDLINRRTHLYLSFFLFPWFLMYGFTSLMISHLSWFRSSEGPQWNVLFDKEYEFPMQDNQDIREVAQQILSENGFEGGFWANQPNPNRVNITQFNFWKVNRLTYFPKKKRLLAEQQKLGWDQIILRMHFRAGYIQPYFWHDLWAFLVDLVCVSILVWIASGLYMWWKIKKTRNWGWLAIAAGFVSFGLLIWGL